jgi:hypothetical protein
MLTPPINESAELTRGALYLILYSEVFPLSLLFFLLSVELVLSDWKITHLQIHIGHDPIVGHRPRVLRLCYLHAHQVPLTGLQISSQLFEYIQGLVTTPVLWIRIRKRSILKGTVPRDFFSVLWIRDPDPRSGIWCLF